MHSGAGTDTRSQILDYLKRSPRTVPELADFLGITRNAIRSQLVELRATGSVERIGSRPSSRRPAGLYGVTPQLAVDESRAYAPVLAELLLVLRERLDPDTIVEVMRAVGSRLAASRPRPAGSRSQRVRHAHAVLRSLGATVDLIPDDDGYRLVGFSCPLSAAVDADPRVCEAVRSMLSEIIGEELTEQCDRGPRPRCCFALAS